MTDGFTPCQACIEPLRCITGCELEAIRKHREDEAAAERADQRHAEAVERGREYADKRDFRYGI